MKVLYTAVLLTLLAGNPSHAAGPWEALVVDAVTQAPLESVAVLAVWHRRAHGHPAIGLGRTGFHSAVEATSGADGRFRIPSRVFFDPPPFFPVEGPQLVFFKLGYGGWRFRGSSRNLTGPGVVIEMRPLPTDAEQVDYLERRRGADPRALAGWEHAEGPANPYDVPYESASRYEAAINAVRAARGLGPTGIGFPHLTAEYFTPTPPEPPGHVRLRQPHGIAVAANGDVYVADTNNHRIVKLGPRLERLATWGTFGRGDGQMQLPRGVAVDGGVVYVADWGNHRVQAFTTDGRFLRKWGRLRSDDLGGTFTPTTIVATRGGELVVYAGRVYRFSASGSVLGKWGRPFQLASRSEIAVDADGHVYAITGQAGARERVIKHGRDGAPLASWAREGQGVGELFDPIALAVDHAGRVYVACWGGGENPRVVVYDARGTFVHQWDVASGTAAWLRMPTALAIDAQGIVYVIDLKQDRIRTLPTLGR